MKVSVDWLEEYDAPYDCLWEEVVSEHRWYDRMRGVFRADGKCWLVSFTRDASETQEGQFDTPFEMFQDANGMVDVVEAESYEKVVTSWREKKENG